MGNIPKQKNLDFKKLSYQHATSIKKFDEEFNYNFFIPEFEKRKDSKGSIDWQLVEDGNYIKSAKKVGTINNIIVAVCPEDPLKSSEDSIYRIHGRVMDARTRYLSSLKFNTKWPVTYIKVKDFEQFIWLWSHCNSLKGGNRKDEENKILQLCMYRHDKLGIPKEDIGAAIVSQYGSGHPFSDYILYKIISHEYKQKTKVESAKKAVKQRIENNMKRPRKKMKKDTQISKLTVENTELINESLEKEKKIKSLESELSEMEKIKIIISQPLTIKLKDSKQITVKFDMNSMEFIVIDN